MRATCSPPPVFSSRRGSVVVPGNEARAGSAPPHHFPRPVQLTITAIGAAAMPPLLTFGLGSLGTSEISRNRCPSGDAIRDPASGKRVSGVTSTVAPCEPHGRARHNFTGGAAGERLRSRGERPTRRPAAASDHQIPSDGRAVGVEREELASRVPRVRHLILRAVDQPRHAARAVGALARESLCASPPSVSASRDISSDIAMETSASGRKWTRRLADTGRR